MQTIEPYLKPGFTDYLGNIWPITALDAYNQHTQGINQLLQREPQPGSTLYKELETLKNNRHRFFVTMAELFQEIKLSKELD